MSIPAYMFYRNDFARRNLNGLIYNTETATCDRT